MSELYELMPLTDEENRLLEDWLTVVDYFGRLAGAVETGSWFYSLDKASELRDALKRFENRLKPVMNGEDGQPVLDQQGELVRKFVPPNVDTKRLHQAVIAYSQMYTFGRLLYPVSDLEDLTVREVVKARTTSQQAFAAESGSDVGQRDGTWP